MLAGVTAACFGVPIAATVVQRFLRAEAERLRRREILAIAQSAVSAIGESLERLSAGRAVDMAEKVDRVRERIHTIDRRMNPRFRFDAPADLEDIQRSVRSVLGEVQQFGFGEEVLNEAEFLSMRNRWRVLDDAVRVQAELVGMHAISDSVARNIGQDLTLIDNGALYGWLGTPEPDFCVVDLRSMLNAIRERGSLADDIRRYDSIVHHVAKALLEIVDTLNSLDGLRLEVVRAQHDISNVANNPR